MTAHLHDHARESAASVGGGHGDVPVAPSLEGRVALHVTVDLAIRAVVAAVGIPVMYLLSGGVGVALLLYYRLVHGGRAIARRPPPA